MATVPKMIQEIMQYNLWNQQEFAERLKFEPCQVSRWLAGKAMPSGKFLIKIQEKYNELPEKIA